MTSRSIARRAWADGPIRVHAPVGSAVDIGAQVVLRLPASACTVLPAGDR